jgi:hypothetical protein
MGFDSRIGIAGLAVGVIGIAITLLWPDKKWVGWLFLVMGFGILLFWGVTEIKQHLGGGRASLILSICVGIFVGGAAAYLIWRSATSENQVLARSDLSNAQVKDGAQDLARRLRDLQQQMNQESGQNSTRLFAEMTTAQQIKNKTARADAITKAQAKYMSLTSEQSSKNDARFGQLRAESRNVINLLQNRVPPPQPLPSELVGIILAGGPLAGPNPVGSVADYIDQLADLVPVNR